MQARLTLVALVSTGLLACPDENTPAADTSDAIADTDGSHSDSGGDSGDGEVSEPTCDAELALAEQGVTLRSTCGGEATLGVEVSWDGEWRSPTSCSGDAPLVCEFGPVSVRVEVAGDAVTVTAEAVEPGVFGGVALAGDLTLPGATAWLSNGFQSWSQSGALAIGPAPPEAQLQAALALEGDEEVLREGPTHAWWHTWVGGGALSLVAGALSAHDLRTWLQATRVGSALRLRIVAGGVPADAVSLATGATMGETWHLAMGDDLVALQRRYGEALRARSRRGGEPAAAEAGWNSWYELWDAVDADAVSVNAALAAEIWDGRLPDGAPPLRIVVDDGWQQAWGRWLPNEKFPDGLDGLAAQLKGQGFEVGVWLAPLLVDADDPLVAEHPEWLVDGASYFHAKNGVMRVLDPTHPGARAHIAEFISRIVDWGFDFLKIDFLFAGTFEGTRAEPVTGMAAYRLALETIREAAGEDVVLLAVGAPGVPSLPSVDAWRVGYDIALEPFGASWYFVPNQARSVAARWPLCLAVLCDADPPLLRDLPRSEVEVGGWVAALPGGALFLSDDLRVLPEERRTWGLDERRIALGLGGEPAWPVDPVPAAPPELLTNPLLDHIEGEARHVVPAEWALPDGGSVVIDWEAREVGGVR